MFALETYCPAIGRLLGGAHRGGDRRDCGRAAADHVVPRRPAVHRKCLLGGASGARRSSTARGPSPAGTPAPLPAPVQDEWPLKEPTLPQAPVQAPPGAEPPATAAQASADTAASPPMHVREARDRLALAVQELEVSPVPPSLHTAPMTTPAVPGAGGARGRHARSRGGGRSSRVRPAPAAGADGAAGGRHGGGRQRTAAGGARGAPRRPDPPRALPLDDRDASVRKPRLRPVPPGTREGDEPPRPRPGGDRRRLRRQAMRPDDCTFATYRGHDHTLARGVPMTPVMRRADGPGATGSWPARAARCTSPASSTA